MTSRLDASLAKARAAKPVAERVFSGLVGGVAVGITRIGDVYGLKINLTTSPPPGLQLPQEIDGVPVRIEVVGVIEKR